MSADFVHIDFETRSAADLLVVGADVYAQHHTTDAMCLGIGFNDEPIDLWYPGKVNTQLPRLLEHVKAGQKFSATTSADLKC